MQTVMVPTRRTARVRRILAAGSILTLTAGVAGLLLASCASPAQETGPGSPAAPVSRNATGKPAIGTADRQSAKLTLVGTRRINELQYKHAIADIFGPAIKVEGRFEPEIRKDGLLAIGSSEGSISDSGFAQYFAIARSIADQVLLTTPTQENQKAAVQ